MKSNYKIKCVCGSYLEYEKAPEVKIIEDGKRMIHLYLSKYSCSCKNFSIWENKINLGFKYGIHLKDKGFQLNLDTNSLFAKEKVDILLFQNDICLYGIDSSIDYIGKEYFADLHEDRLVEDLRGIINKICTFKNFE